LYFGITHAVLQTSYPKDQYIPALKYRELPPVKSKRKQQVNGFEIYPAWEIVSDKYELAYIDMPMACVGVVQLLASRLNSFLEKAYYATFPNATGNRHPYSL